MVVGERRYKDLLKYFSPLVTTGGMPVEFHVSKNGNVS